MTRQPCRYVLKLELLGLLLAVWTGLARADTENAKEFSNRVKTYLEIQKQVSSKVPPLTTTEVDSAKIAIRTKALANGIQQRRTNAKQGDLFFPQVAQEFREIIRQELQGKNGAAPRKAVKTGNPAEEEGGVAKIVLAVNAPYPDKAPRSSVPATILLSLPELPKGLEYRFLGPHLILLDSMSNLIVDYLPDVVPKVQGAKSRQAG
jgi:hypothetical protein